jgi:hypothetical protein
MYAHSFICLLVCSVVLAARAADPAMAESDEASGLEARISKLMSEGKWGEAVTLAERRLELVRAQNGEDHVDTAQALEGLAGLYNIQRRLAEAEPLYKRALAADSGPLRTVIPAHRGQRSGDRGQFLIAVQG